MTQQPPPQTRAWPLLGDVRMSADYATGRGDRNLKWAEPWPRAVRVVRVAAARDLGECRALKEGVDAGGGDRRCG